MRSTLAFGAKSPVDFLAPSCWGGGGHTVFLSSSIGWSFDNKSEKLTRAQSQQRHISWKDKNAPCTDLFCEHSRKEFQNSKGALFLFCRGTSVCYFPHLIRWIATHAPCRNRKHAMVCTFAGTIFPRAQCESKIDVLNKVIAWMSHTIIVKTVTQIDTNLEEIALQPGTSTINLHPIENGALEKITRLLHLRIIYADWKWQSSSSLQTSVAKTQQKVWTWLQKYFNLVRGKNRQMDSRELISAQVTTQYPRRISPILIE